MNFTDVYGIKHENCTIVKPAKEYSRIIVFMDSVGRKFVAVGPNPEPSKYGSTKSHWKQGKPTEAPEGYFYVNK